MLVSTITNRQKYRNLLADDRVTLCVVQPSNLNRYVEIRGRAVLTPDHGRHVIDEIARVYMGVDRYPLRSRGRRARCRRNRARAGFLARDPVRRRSAVPADRLIVTMGYHSIEGVEVTSRHHLLTIRLHRPERRNAMTPDQVNYVGQLCAAAEQDDDVRVVLLTGVGTDFCRGADLSSVDLTASGGQTPPITMGRNLYLPMLELSKPLIGAVNGVAAGGGLGLALSCDLRLASEEARFVTAATRIALTANDAVAWLLPRVVGVAKALELIYLSRPIDAAEAERIGLVSYVYPHDEFEGAVAEFVDSVLSGPPVALRFSKRLVLDGLNRTYRDHVIAQEYAALSNRVIADHDIQEGVTAFNEKRAPKFRGQVDQPRWDNY